MTLRILAVFVLLISILYMPFWVSAILALAGMIYFSLFWESAILFLLSDLLFGVKEARFLDITFISFIVSILILLIIEFLKKKIRISKEI
ncbi:MAG: hypothetical protein WCS86_00925 [Candidatus Paceibacterota bacterium]